MTTPDVAAAYDDHASAYSAYTNPAMAAEADQFAYLLPAGSRILDAGCGPGRDLARFTARGHHPVGVDLNERFLALASASGEVHHGDLPLPDAPFDAVWACASLVHLPTPDAHTALRELARVSRPGAPACASVKHIGRTGWADTIHGRRWFQIWEPAQFATAVTAAGFTGETTEVGPVFVDVWAYRA